MLQYLIVCPLVFLAGFVDSIAGGGGLISLPAYLIAGLPTHISIGTNKLASSMGTVVSTGRYLKNGYLKGSGMGRLAVCAAAVALCGSAMGSRLSVSMDERVLQGMMVVILPVVAFYVLRNKDLESGAKRPALTQPQLYAAVLLAALVIGAYDGFYGPGTGAFLILVLTGAARMKVRTASALTKVVNLSSNLAALAMFLYHGTVDIRLGLTAGIFSIAGHYLGSGLVVHNGQRIVRPVVLAVLTVLFVKIIAGF